jgi:hypothetical protein
VSESLSMIDYNGLQRVMAQVPKCGHEGMWGYFSAMA